MQITLAEKPVITYVDETADLNIPGSFKDYPVYPNCGPYGKIDNSEQKAEELLQKGFAVKEQIYDMLLSGDSALLRRLISAKPEATLSLLGRILPKDDFKQDNAEKKMPILIINNTAQAAVSLSET